MSLPAGQLSIRPALLRALAATSLAALGVLGWLAFGDSAEKPTPGHAAIPSTSKVTTPVQAPPKPIVSAPPAEMPDDVEIAASPAPEGPSMESERHVQAVLDLSRTSPFHALRWVLAQPREHSGPAIIAAAYEVAREHPSDALNALADLASSPERDAAIAHAASQWGCLEPTAAVKWAAGLPPGPLREHACTAVAIAMAGRDPRAAADFVATQIADGMALRTAAVSVAQRWAQQQPAAALAWASEFPAGPTRDDALREIAQQSR